MSMLKEYYLQPDAPDPVLAEAEVLRCVRRFMPTAKAVTGVDESGGEARIYIVDEVIMVKVQRPQQVRVGTSLAREVFYLNQLAAAAPDLPVPRVLGYSRDTNLLEYNIQTRMPGVAYVNASLAPEAQRNVIFSLGRLLRRLHAIPQQPFHDSAHFPTDRTSADFRARLSEYFDVVAGRLEKNGRTWPLEIPFESVRERTLAALSESQEFLALHSNPGPPHTFVDPSTGRFQGLIDFGDAYISHPALDVWRWRWPAERVAALAGYTADSPVGDDFMRTWKAVTVAASAVLVAFFPDRESEATTDLRRSLSDL
ncbi:MAG TPA: aminoglycoside phosphotransferase family protein [Burkholderiales bacterium]|nr:aminoglycoside phosphotransferase family protein [Burkholderiales bacterium]